MGKYRITTDKGTFDVTTEHSESPFKQVVKQAGREALMRPGTLTRNLMSDPATQAKALPALAGFAGGLSPIPGGATMGTVGGRQLSNAALKSYGMGDQIPYQKEQLIEGGLAAIGDIAAIPAMKKAYFGKQIGQAEKNAGVITRAPMQAVTPGTVGKTLNGLEQAIDSGAINTPQAAKDAKAIVNQIYKNPRIYEQTSDIAVQSARVSDKVQNLLNKLIEPRAKPAADMARAMTIPNFIKKSYTALPWPVKRGAQGALGWEGVKHLLGL